MVAFKKMMKSRKGFIALAGPAAWVVLALMLIPVFIGGAGIIKFLVSDKTPYIIGGLFIFLFLFGQKKREGRI